MGQTLTNGIYLPAEGERNCYEGLAANWTALDGMIGGYNVHISNTTIHVTAEDKQAWNGKADASALTAHTGDNTIHVTAEDKAAWNGKADASALTAHTGDTTIHVTSADKQAWNGKADASALTAHTGDTTIHVTSADKEAWDGHVADSVKHVTAADKAKWDAVTSKADDSDVVHKSGNETIAGVKTFRDDIIKGLTTIASRIIKGGGNTPAVGSNGVGFIQSQAILTYQDSTPSKDVTVTLEVTDSSYADGRSRAYFPNSNNSINLGKSGKRWANVYATNYYYGGSEIEFSRKFVTTDTAQTISGNKTFSSINGVEPSSLSLPSDINSRIDISSYFTNTGTGQSNSYTVPANGYIYLTLSELTNIHCFSRTSGNVINYAQTFTKPNNSTGALYVLFPVRKNDVFVTTWYTTTTVSVDGACFIPCKGNI